MVQKQGNIAANIIYNSSCSKQVRPVIQDGEHSLPDRSKFMRPLRYLHNVFGAWQVIHKAVYSKLNIRPSNSEGQMHRKFILIQTKISSSFFKYHLNIIKAGTVFFPVATTRGGGGGRRGGLNSKAAFIGMCTWEIIFGLKSLSTHHLYPQYIVHWHWMGEGVVWRILGKTFCPSFF